MASRILAQAKGSGHDSTLIYEASNLPPAEDVDLLFVNWDERGPGLGALLAEWREVSNAPPPRIIVFGAHADLQAHAEARAAGLGPMWARSKLVSALGDELR